MVHLVCTACRTTTGLQGHCAKCSIVLAGYGCCQAKVRRHAKTLPRTHMPASCAKQAVEHSGSINQDTT
jgi:hypothetical protein